MRMSGNRRGQVGQDLGALRPFALCDGVMGVFAERRGGVSAGPFSTLNLSLAVGDDPAAVASNRDLVLRMLAPGPVRLAWMRQVHGATVGCVAAEPARLAGSGTADPGPQADALFTRSAGVALCALVADCAPVLIADPLAGLAGAAHAGRPGLVAGVVPALGKAMCEAGAEAARMRAVIGPASCGQGYDVPPQRRDRGGARVPG